MNRTVRQLSYLSALLLLVGCLPKRALYFFTPSRPFSHAQQQQALSPVVTRDSAASSGSVEPVQPDRLPFTAATNPEVLVRSNLTGKLSAAHKGNVQPERGTSLGRQQARPVGLQKAVAKKLGKKVQGKRPVHRFAWLSALFTVAGLVLFVIGTTGLVFSFGVYVGACLSLILFALAFLSFVTAAIIGITGILKINKIPGRFSGAGLATVSSVISLLIVGVYLYNLLLLLLFFLV